MGTENIRFLLNGDESQESFSPSSINRSQRTLVSIALSCTVINVSGYLVLYSTKKIAMNVVLLFVLDLTLTTYKE